MSGLTVVNCTPGMDELENDFAQKLTLGNAPKAAPRKTKKSVKKEPKKKEEDKKLTEEEVKRLVEKRVFEAQMKLLESDVTEEELKAAADLLLPVHYDEVVEERVAASKCGYPCCHNKLTKKKPKGKYYFTADKVYDMTHANDFCSDRCNLASRVFQKTLKSVPLLMRVSYKDIADLVKNGAKKEEFDNKPDGHVSFGSESVVEHEIDDLGIAIGGVDEEKIRERMKGDDSADDTAAALHVPVINPSAIEGYDPMAFRNANVSLPGTSCNLESKANYNMLGFEYDVDVDLEDDEFDNEEEEEEDFFDDMSNDNDDDDDDDEGFPKLSALSERYKDLRLSEEEWVSFFLDEWKTDYTNLAVRKMEMPSEAKKIGPTAVSPGDKDATLRKGSFVNMIKLRYRVLEEKYGLPFVYIKNMVNEILNTFMFRDQVPAFSEKQLMMFCLVFCEIVRTRFFDRENPSLSAAVLIASQEAMKAYGISNDRINSIIRRFFKS